MIKLLNINNFFNVFYIDTFNPNNCECIKMKFKNIILISLILIIFSTLTVVSASQDNITTDVQLIECNLEF